MDKKVQKQDENCESLRSLLWLLLPTYSYSLPIDNSQIRDLSCRPTIHNLHLVSVLFVNPCSHFSATQWLWAYIESSNFTGQHLHVNAIVKIYNV